MEVFCAAIARHGECSPAQSRCQYYFALPRLLQSAASGSSCTAVSVLPIDWVFESSDGNNYPSKRRGCPRQDKRRWYICPYTGRTRRVVAVVAPPMGMAVLLWKRPVVAISSGAREHSPNPEDTASVYSRRWPRRCWRRGLLHVGYLAL